MALYKLTLDGTTIIRTSDNAVIPVKEENRNYREYLDWISRGNVADPADPAAADDPENKVSAKRMVRILKKIRQWIKSQDPAADIPPIDPD